jgi:YD repeat-containing protein
MRASVSQYPLATTKGGYVGYSQVTQIFGINEEGGRSQYYYSFDYDDSSEGAIWPFPPVNTLEWTRGNLLKKEDYNASGQLLKRTTNSYTFERSSSAPHSFTGVGVKVAATHTNGICFEDYNIHGEWYHLDSTIEETFNQDAAEVFVAKTDFFYQEPLAHIQPTVIVSHLGVNEIMRTIKRYPTTPNSSFSYTMSSSDILAKDIMVDEYLIGTPLEEVIEKERNGQIAVISKSFYRHDLTNDQKIELKELFIGSDNESYYKKICYDQYDDQRNLVQYTLHNSQPSAFIWSNNKKFMVAKAENATSANIFHTSFEETGAIQTISSPARTGSRYLNTGVFNFSSNGFVPGSTTNLKMSYWYWSSNQWNFSGVVDWSNSINAGTRLDEIRVFPGDSQMTTYTYKPGIGISSMTDTNNVTSYYEYDSFGRLMSIKDDKGNVLQHYTYNYKQN